MVDTTECNQSVDVQHDSKNSAMRTEPTALQTATYLLSQDIIPTLTGRFRLSLSRETIADIQSIENCFCDEFGQFMDGKQHIEDGVAIATFSSYVLTSEAIRKGLPKTRSPILSLDDIFGADAQYKLHVTRQTNPNNTAEKELGPRPGYQPIDAQIHVLAKEIGKKPVALYDVGIFDGETLLHILDRLEEAGIQFESVNVSIANAASLSKMEQRISCPFNAQTAFRFGEWVEVRDFIGLDGRKPLSRVVPQLNGNNGFMLYGENLQWASVNGKTESETASFRAEAGEICWRYQHELARSLQKAGIDFSLTRVPVETKTPVYALNLR